MLAEVLRSFFKNSKKPQACQPVPRPLSKVRKYASSRHQILRWEDGTFYDGECSNGTIFDGVGKLCMENGQFYQGMFRENQFHGTGRFTYSDGSYYEGEWSNDIRNGIGKQVNKDGTEYFGAFKNGVKNGYGVLIWNDGSFYEGNFHNDLMEGIGKFRYADGSTYIGQWTAGKENGSGQLSNASVLYKGNFLNGIKHGKGVELNKKTGVRIEGTWQEGKLVGKIQIFEQNRVSSAKMIQESLSYLTDAQYQCEAQNQIKIEQK